MKIFFYMYNVTYTHTYDRRKFRSQTSDNMDRWKSRGGKSQRGEEPKREDQRRERVRRKKVQVAKHCVLPTICGSRGSKSRLAKAAGAEPCGQMRDEQLHAVVARSTFASEKAKSTSRSEHFGSFRCRKGARRCGAKHVWKSKVWKTDGFGALLEVEMSKKRTPLWREAHSEVKCTKHVSLGALLEVEMFKKCTRLWREAHFQVNMLKAPHARTTFEDLDVVLRGRLKGFCTLPKVSKTWGFVACPKTMAGVGHFKRIWKDTFCVAGAVQKTCSSEMLGGQGADFLRGVAFWSIRSSGLLRWFCVTGAAIRMTWHHFCVAGAALYTDGVEKSKTHWYEAVSSALSFPFLKEVSQNCFVLDVVNFENGRKSRRIASFLKPSSSKNENVSQNCFVFKLAERQIDR